MSLARRFDIRQTLGSVCDPLAPFRVAHSARRLRFGGRRAMGSDAGGPWRPGAYCVVAGLRHVVPYEHEFVVKVRHGRTILEALEAHVKFQRDRRDGGREHWVRATYASTRRPPAAPPSPPRDEPRRANRGGRSFPRGRPARSVPSAGRTSTSLPPDVRRPAERRAPRYPSSPRVGLRTRARFDRRRVRRPPPPSHRRRDPPRVVVRPPVARRPAPRPGRAPPRPAPRPRTRRPRGRPGGAPRGRGDRHRR